MIAFRLACVFLALTAPITIALSPSAAEGPGISQKVQKNVSARIKAGCFPGCVVGLVGADGQSWFCRGTFTYDAGKKVTPETIFEIGSITKAFTGILLADAVARREVSLDDPITRFLPPGVMSAASNEHPITLLHLAQHRSGLPRLPSNFNEGSDPDNPYAHYDAERLHEFLRHYAPQRKPGDRYEYSNLGAGLLGYLLGRAAEKPYAALVEERICRPLGMNDTTCRPSAGQSSRLAPGHSGPRPVANWDGFDVLAPAGALRSTGNDMLAFLAANLGLRESDRAGVLKAATEPRADAGSPGVEVALGWHVSTDKGTEIIWHNGGTGGYRAFCGFAPAKKLGVVILVNSDESADDIGFHLLESSYPLRKAPRTVKLDPGLLDDYVGNYELSPGAIIEITLEGRTLYAKLTGQPALPVYPRSKTEFHYRAVEARLTFQRDDEGHVKSVTLHQNGRDMPARRLGDDFVPPAPRQSIEVPMDILKKYVGRYELQPGTVFDVRLEGEQLTVQLTGQGRYPVYPESQSKFFYKVVDAQLTFVVGEDGRATSLVLHQFGMDQTASRLPE